MSGEEIRYHRMSGSWGESSFMMQEIVLYQLKERATVPLTNELLTLGALCLKGKKTNPYSVGKRPFWTNRSARKFPLLIGDLGFLDLIKF